jgi:hypothetical protein
MGVRGLCGNPEEQGQGNACEDERCGAKYDVSYIDKADFAVKTLLITRARCITAARLNRTVWFLGFADNTGYAATLQ